MLISNHLNRKTSLFSTYPSLNIEPCRMLVSPQSTGHSVGVRDPRYHSQQLGKLHPYS